MTHTSPAGPALHRGRSCSLMPEAAVWEANRFQITSQPSSAAILSMGVSKGASESGLLRSGKRGIAFVTLSYKATASSLPFMEEA